MTSRALAWLLGAPLVAFAVFPLVMLFAKTTATAGPWLDEATTEALWGTVSTSAGAASFAFAVGLPMALVLGRCDVPARAWLEGAFTLPSAIPPYIWTMGWIALANPRTGFLNVVAGHSWLNIYGRLGIAFVLGTSALPLVFLPARAALARVDPCLEEAARMAGAGPWRTLRDVSFPLALPAALSGTTLVFLFSAASFGVPYLLGVAASSPTHTLTTRIYGKTLEGTTGLGDAARLSLWLLVLSFAVMALASVAGRSGRVRLLSGKGLSERRLALGSARLWVTGAVVALALGLVAAPLVAVVLSSLQSPKGLSAGLTLAHWEGVLTHPRTLDSLLRSVGLAAIASAVVVLLGLGFAFVAPRTGRTGQALKFLAEWPYAVPGTVLALGWLIAFGPEWRFIVAQRLTFVLALGNSLWLVGVAYVIKHLAMGVRSATDALAQVDTSLSEAARLCGAHSAQAFRHAVWPQIRGALLAAATLCFLTCLTELTMSVLIVPSGSELLGTLIFEMQSYADPSGAAVIATFVVLLVVACMVAIHSRPRVGARP